MWLNSHKMPTFSCKKYTFSPIDNEYWYQKKKRDKNNSRFTVFILPAEIKQTRTFADLLRTTTTQKSPFSFRLRSVSHTLHACLWIHAPVCWAFGGDLKTVKKSESRPCIFMGQRGRCSRGRNWKQSFRTVCISTTFAQITAETFKCGSLKGGGIESRNNQTA